MIKLGKFDLGIRFVTVYADPNIYGAKFSYTAHDESRIVIGIADNFHGIISNLLHEAAEMVFGEMRLRYTPSPEIGRDNGAYFFAMDHTAFSEAMSRVAVLVEKLFPILYKLHKKHAKSRNRG